MDREESLLLGLGIREKQPVHDRDVSSLSVGSVHCLAIEIEGMPPSYDKN